MYNIISIYNKIYNTFSYFFYLYTNFRFDIAIYSIIDVNEEYRSVYMKLLHDIKKMFWCKTNYEYELYKYKVKNWNILYNYESYFFLVCDLLIRSRAEIKIYRYVIIFIGWEENLKK